MINIEVKTKLSTEEAMNKLKRFFSDKGLGLETTEENETCITFSGGGGYVSATLCPEEKGTRIDLVSMEWERQVKAFAESVG